MHYQVLGLFQVPEPSTIHYSYLSLLELQNVNALPETEDLQMIEHLLLPALTSLTIRGYCPMKAISDLVKRSACHLRHLYLDMRMSQDSQTDHIPLRRHPDHPTPEALRAFVQEVSTLELLVLTPSELQVEETVGYIQLAAEEKLAERVRMSVEWVQDLNVHAHVLWRMKQLGICIDKSTGVVSTLPSTCTLPMRGRRPVCNEPSEPSTTDIRRKPAVVHSRPSWR